SRGGCDTAYIVCSCGHGHGSRRPGARVRSWHWICNTIASHKRGDPGYSGTLPRTVPGRKGWRLRERNTRMDILWWIIVGLVAGGIASMIVPGRTPGGMIGALIVGVLGGMLGGWLVDLLFDTD